MDSIIRSTIKWKKRSTNLQFSRKPLLLLVLTSFIAAAIFTSSRTLVPPSLFLISRNSKSILPARCTDDYGEKFLWYAPHSGFSNQISEFKNAILMAAILNRTLIVPPILDHHAVALGSCPKFRVLDPNELRFKVWNHSIQLIHERRYVSMADINDLSSLVSISAAKFIDFRTFVYMWCGVDFSLLCTADSSRPSSLHEKLAQCGSLLSGYNGNVDNCLYAVQEDCRNTVWTYRRDDEDGVLDSFQADNELKKKKKISFMRKRKDVYKALGPGSAAKSAAVLALGSLFTSPYKGSESHIDIHESQEDQRINSLVQKIEFLPFVSEILDSAKRFAIQTIKAPFLCAQLRLLDGQFKNHWKSTFSGLKQKLDLLKEKVSLPIHIFIMTDLPLGNWTGSYLANLAEDPSAKLFVLREEDELVAEAAKKIVNAGYSMRFQSVSTHFERREDRCESQSLPDILLYLEETVCSCASLGFVGTVGSTIGDSIELMRKHWTCSQ